MGKSTISMAMFNKNGVFLSVASASIYFKANAAVTGSFTLGLLRSEGYAVVGSTHETDVEVSIAMGIPPKTVGLWLVYFMENPNLK